MKKFNKYLIKNKEKIIDKRYSILIVIIIIVMMVLLIKLFDVQIIKNKYYKEKLESITSNIVYGTSAPRGRIYDRNGKLIVDNKIVKVVYYKKKSGVTLKDEINTSYLLGEYLDFEYKTTDNMIKTFWIKNNTELANNLITEEEKILLKERKISSSDIEKYKLERINIENLNYEEKDYKAAYIYYLMNKGYSFAQKDIKKNVTDLEYAKIGENLDKLPGVGVKLDWEREYLYGDTLRVILGNVSSSETGIPYDKKDYYLNLGYSLEDRVGTSYLELQYESILKGTKNTYEIINGDYVLKEEGKRGNDIVLTIDIELQQEIEKILDEEILKTKNNERNTEYYNGSTVIISDPNTGEILAMTSKKVTKTDGKYITYDYTPAAFLEPIVVGSVVKGASHIVGYNTGALKIGEVRKDTCLKIASTPSKCSWKYLGTLNDLTALKMSSNTYQYNTAIKVGNGTYKYNKSLSLNLDAYETYRNTFYEFGLGVKTGIDLPLESVGYKGGSSNGNLLLDFAIGQYDTYTPLQLNQYINTIATGNRYQLHLLKGVYEDSSLKEINLNLLNTITTESQYIERVRKGFKMVMESGGTGSGYISKSFKSAGKTGTSQSIIDTNSDGKVDTMVLNNTFVGYAPYDNPIVSFTVVSPNIYHYKGKTTSRTYVNMRISSAISKKFFEIYK